MHQDKILIVPNPWIDASLKENTQLKLNTILKVNTLLKENTLAKNKHT